MTTATPYSTYARGLGALGSLANKEGYGGIGSTLGNTGSAFGLLSGLQQGGVGGYGSATANAGRLAGNLLDNKSLNMGATALSNVLGIYNGIKQEGLSGYGGAAANAAQLGGNLAGNSALSSLGGYVAAPLALYNFGKNWKSGDTGSDAASGAAAGAAIGSVVPVVGTALGALIGGAGGALSSAFGPGKIDPETHMVQGLLDTVGAHPDQAKQITSSVDNPYLQLAGLMDRRESTLPIYQQYGRMGEQKFTTDLANKLQTAKDSGVIKPGENAEQAYNDVIAPWVNSMGSGWNNVGQTYKDTTQGLLQDMTSQYLGGQAASNWKAVGGDSPFSNIYNTQNNPTPTPVSSPSTPGHQSMLAAEGGLMKSKKSALSELYKRNFADHHYDEGGSVDYFSDPSLGITGPSQDFSFSLPGAFAPSSGVNSNGVPTDIALPNNSGEYGMGYYNQNSPYTNTDPNSSGSSGDGGVISGLQNLLGPYARYAALLPILGSLTGLTNSKQPQAPTPGPGMSNGVATPFQIPNFTRQQTQVNPNTDWYTYGQHPETQFFQNNQLPNIPGFSPASAAPQSTPAQPSTPQKGLQPFQGAIMAKGGALESTFNSGQGDTYVEGPGDGTSDDIPAKLSDGEYVMDAGTVSMLGNGSNKAGAAALDKLRQNVRKHAGKKMAKGEQFMKAHPPEKYLKSSGG